MIEEMTQKLKNAPKIDNSVCNLCYCKNCLGRIEHLEGKMKYQCVECGKLQLPYNIGVEPERNVVIDKIGVEMEGHWKGNAPDHGSGVTYHGDGSVHFSMSQMADRDSCVCCAGNCTDSDHDEDDCCDGTCGKRNLRNVVGEYVTNPIPYSEDLGVLKNLIFRNYPHNVNESCGGHFHISFITLGYYGLSMDKKVYQNVMKAFKAWAIDGKTKKAPAGFTKSAQDKISIRLKGVGYCKKVFASDEQILGYHSDRYTQFNFRAFHKHKTLEIRLLPMFNRKEDYYRSVRFLCNEITKQILSIGLGSPLQVEAKRDMEGKISKIDSKRVDDSPSLEVN